jgi:hypothetical protein
VVYRSWLLPNLLNESGYTIMRFARIKGPGAKRSSG